MNGERGIIWLASYPKSGNTWVRLLLGNLLGLQEDENAGDGFLRTLGISSSREMFERLVGLNTFELSDAEIDRLRPATYRLMAERAKQAVFIKAHDAFRVAPGGEPLFPGDCSRGVIYIVRNPLDVAISFAHHRGDRTPDEIVKNMNDPDYWLAGGSSEQLRQVLFDWSSHYRSWTEQGSIRALVVRYEDLSSDTAAQLRRIVAFCGIEEARFVRSIEDAVEASRFERLQQKEAERGFAERSPKAERFFRSGRIGEGREKLPHELQRQLIAQHGDVMRELGYL